ncbi:MAG: cytochrome P450, partial [Myxococcales bacterium]|nr:cytochrome P450 [Myxococcales bacterium]
ERALHEELVRVPDEKSPELLVYSEQIVKEAMRLYPPAYVLARKACRDTTIGTYAVPKGSEVVVWTYFTHRDPRFYPDPTAFKPERFAPEEEAKLPKQAYLPFGAGPRACIGKMFAQVEATVVLAVLARSLRFRYARKQPPVPQPRITLGPAGGMPMLVSR